MASKQGKDNGLNARQQAFADNYILDPSNSTQDAIKAGYARRSASVAANRMLKNDKIQAYLRNRTKKMDQKKIASQQDVLELFSKGVWGTLTEKTAVSSVHGAEVVETPIAIKDRLKSAELFGKATGMFVDKHEITSMKPIIIQTDTGNDEGVDIDD